jgi:hypothetical protein
MWYSNLEKRFLLDICSTNIDTPDPLLYQCGLSFHPFPHLRFDLLVISEPLPLRQEFLDPSCKLLCSTNPSHRKHETFLYEYSSYKVLLPTKTHNKQLLFRALLEHGRHFDYWNQPLNMHVHLLLRLSWSWTVLLPSDMNRKPITSITAVLLQFVIYLLTLAPTFCISIWWHVVMLWAWAVGHPKARRLLWKYATSRFFKS